MEIINNNTVVVFTSEELKSVLESDNTYTYIYIGNNITLTLEEHSTFNITTYNRLNLFTNSIDITSNISESTLPTYSWYKSNLSIVKGTFTNTLTTITENNYTEEELTNLPSLDEDTLITGNTLSPIVLHTLF